MFLKLWSQYPLDVTAANGRMVILIAPSGTLDAIAEEAARLDFTGEALVHVTANHPAQAATFVLAAHAPLLEGGAQLVVNGTAVPLPALPVTTPRKKGK